LRSGQRIKRFDLFGDGTETDGFLTAAHNARTIAHIILYYNIFPRPSPMAQLTLSMVHAIISTMTVRIDKAGRIVLPKPVRERFHLREGSELELEERSDGLTLRPVEQRPSMVRKNGIWVHLGKVPRGFDWDTAVDAIREERIKDTSGA
jgi:AbrB family looped-hinge helix DNA binding protein